MPWTGVNPVQDPPEYDPENKYADPVLYYRHREAAVTEAYIKVSEAKVLRRKLKECYRTEGIDHLTQCKEVAQKYLEAIKGVGIYKANSGPHDKATWAKDKQ
ncbi:hypothetical protein ACKKBG_A24135 [Auxenochlorella protothecoides x Auxenochlorella symbiontica]|uniref:NADH dehydrogenase [ubiquinone] 1 beta subcomplex subunit 10-A n=1 Tax=Auxenochlorella protothecoides TaxID=3075 RepID=A0A087SI51_AUXPR|nr:NADH dehydrogenase [ubiquinone] 1 beta subcomplex subunit 10-A [Auxenochlorella protothecoides]KFM25405.1 NADH dehydrogenase [ubiquinone] 1 beta subcomplex subunit 10-A [Auxenochlorella protothecoides]RMZ55089.1 hypothetical protein APUTEX25_005715 [Auxenochlorella protothecoides]|eukprot:RMZ55089.1 hypothetical protein APUTEX25_005715 [Auxenochlorella protothecoides]